jgi:hypothetical protein
MAWFKIFNFQNVQRIPAIIHDLLQDNGGHKYIPYFGSKDNFPLIWHQAISESPSAVACLSTIQDFLQGHGFSDETLETKIVNSKGEDLFQIHQKTCKDFAEFEGFWWLFKYNLAGNISDWQVLPFENCRLGKPDDNGYITKILYNPFFGTKDFNANKKYTIEYDVFNPEAVKDQMAAQKLKYKGQVMFYGTTTATSRYYPMPEAYAGIKWMGIEKGVSDYHEDNISNAFLQPFMLIMKGDPNAPVHNPDGSSTDEKNVQTQAEAFEEMVSDNFMGAKRVGNMWVNWIQQDSEKPEVLAMPTNNTGDLFITIDNQSTKKITIVFKVPGILANIHEGVSLGGDANQIRVAVQLMQQRVVREQRVLTDNYQKILKLFEVPYTQAVTITPYNPYPELVVPDEKIWNALTEDEKRDWIEKNTEIVLGEDVPVSTTPAPAARISNAMPMSFPQEVIDTVKKSLAYVDKMQVKCISRVSRQVSEQIINNQNLGIKQLKRINNYLKKNSQFENSFMNEGCGVIEYNAWGGKHMAKFLESELEKFEKWLN